MAKNDGGPAFPGTRREWFGPDKVDTPESGMSLRDYIAIHATEGDVHWASLVAQGNGLSVSHVEARWLFADAMIAARAQEKEDPNA